MVRQGQSASVRRNKLIVVDAPTAESGNSEEWADLRYRLWSRLYGEGFSLPGGQEVTTQFLKYIDLQKTHTVLDFGRGPGRNDPRGRVAVRRDGDGAGAGRRRGRVGDEDFPDPGPGGAGADFRL